MEIQNFITSLFVSLSCLQTGSGAHILGPTFPSYFSIGEYLLVDKAAGA